MAFFWRCKLHQKVIETAVSMTSALLHLWNGISKKIITQIPIDLHSWPGDPLWSLSSWGITADAPAAFHLPWTVVEKSFVPSTVNSKALFPTSPFLIVPLFYAVLLHTSCLWRANDGNLKRNLQAILLVTPSNSILSWQSVEGFKTSKDLSRTVFLFFWSTIQAYEV